MSKTFSAWMFLSIMSYWWSRASKSLTTLLIVVSFMVSDSGSSISIELGMKSKQNPISVSMSL